MMFNSEEIKPVALHVCEIDRERACTCTHHTDSRPPIIIVTVCSNCIALYACTQLIRKEKKADEEK